VHISFHPVSLLVFRYNVVSIGLYENDVEVQKTFYASKRLSHGSWYSKDFLRVQKIFYATSRSIWIPRLTQHFAHSRQARSESKSLFRNMTFRTGYTRTYGFSRHTLFRLVCMRVRFGPLLTYKSIKGKEMDSPLQKWLLTVLKRMLGVRDTTPSWCVMRECGLEPLQFNWFCAAMRLYNSLTKSNSYTMKKVLHADMQLITWSNDC